MTTSNVWKVVGLIAWACGWETACADTVTWDGGGADNNWSSPTNWSSDVAPVSASATYLKFDGNIRPSPAQDIAAPFVLNRLDFLGSSTGTTAFVIGGSPLQFVTNGVTQPLIYLDRNATCGITNAIDVPAGTTLGLQIGTYGVDLRGAITGGGTLDKSAQAGGISLYNSANTFSGGLIVRANNGDWCKVNIYSSYAMGTGPVSLYGGTLITNSVNPGGLDFYGTTTHTNPITLFAHSPIFAGMPNTFATVTLNGPIDLSAYTLHLRGVGAGTVNGAIANGASSALAKTDAGTWTLGGTNTFTGRITLINGTLKLGAAGSLMPQVPLVFSCATGWCSIACAVFDLNGHTQTVSQLSGTTTLTWLTNVVTSASPSALVVSQDVSTVFNGYLSGAVGLVKAGSGTLTLTNWPGTTTGDVTVSNGALAVAAGATLGNGTNVTVAGGTLALQTSATIRDSATLRIADGAKVSIASGITETVDKLIVNGVPKPRGYYGSSASTGAMYVDDAHFAGAGILYVASNPAIVPMTVTWDAGGADGLMSTAVNWVGDATPAFDGTNAAVFATGGSTATVDVAANLYGLSFNRDGNFTLAAGAGVISNGAGGITAAVPSATGRSYTIAEDMVLTDHQTWYAGTNLASAALTIKGVIDDGFLPYNITKNGFGPMYLSASNTFDGTLTINEGDTTISNPQALGSTNGATYVNGGTGARLLLSGNLTITEPLILNGEKNNAGTLLVSSGSNVISSALICSNQVRFATAGGPLVFSGGVTADNNGLFVINASSAVTFKDKPLNLGARTFWADSGGLTVLAVASNTWADALIAGGTLRCEATNALPASSSFHLGVWYGPAGTLDMAGCDETVGKFYLDCPVAGVRTVTSSKPALLTVNQSSDTLIDARFTGAVSLLKLGSGALALTNAFTTTSGGFAVSNGTLSVVANGTFGTNCMSVAVGGTGTLVLSNSVAIADSASVMMPSNGVSTAKISLGTGVNETVGWLFYGDKMRRVGTYGSTASAAANKDDTHFAGPGVLTVTRDKSGTLVFMR